MRKTFSELIRNGFRLFRNHSLFNHSYRLGYTAMKLCTGLVLLILALIPGCGKGSTTADPAGHGGVDSIQTDNYANLELDYFYYIPATGTGYQQNTYPLLAMIPGLSGRGESFVSNDAKLFADSHGFVIISPSFTWDDENWDSNESYQYPSIWSGDAFLEIIDHFEEHYDISMSSLSLMGYSAGAQFSLRFCVWKPDLCTACAAHGSGGLVDIPDYIDVAFFVTVGSQDEDFRISNYNTFCSRARSLGISVECRQYDTGHNRTPEQMQDSLNFIVRHS